MELKIGKKKYELEYTFEAVLYEKCIEKAIDLIGISITADESDIPSLAKKIATLPKTVVTLFYAGLLEKNPVADEDAAKELLKQYFKEHKGEENASFYGIASMITDQMVEDGFFEQIGMGSEVANQKEEQSVIPMK